MSNKRDKHNSQFFPQQWFLLFSSVASKIGIGGALILFILYWLTFNTTVSQKELLTDRWILLRNNDHCQELNVVIIVFSVFMFSIGSYTFYRIRKLDREEIRRLRQQIF